MIEEITVNLMPNLDRKFEYSKWLDNLLGSNLALVQWSAAAVYIKASQCAILLELLSIDNRRKSLPIARQESFSSGRPTTSFFSDSNMLNWSYPATTWGRERKNDRRPEERSDDAAGEREKNSTVGGLYEKCSVAINHINGAASCY